MTAYTVEINGSKINCEAISRAFSIMQVAKQLGYEIDCVVPILDHVDTVLPDNHTDYIGYGFNCAVPAIVQLDQMELIEL